MSVTLVVPDQIATQLYAAAGESVETGAVLLVSVVVDSNGDMRLLGREIHWVSDEAYLVRDSHRLSITSDGYVPALGIADDISASCLWVHTHPGKGSIPLPSEHDEVVDREINDLFRIRSGSDYYGTLIVSPSSTTTIAFSGYIETSMGERHAIDRLWAVGDHFQLVQSFGGDNCEPSIVFDRQIRAFGGAIQAGLSDLAVGIVGCGGTGSAVAEQLVRLGVRRFSLVDADELSHSNVTRVYGSTLEDVGRQKVDVLANQIAKIAPKAQIKTISAMITEQDAAKDLLTCDIVFGCTDDNAGRLILSRLATYFIIPIIDCGVLLSSGNDGLLRGIDCRITTLIPGQACLVCRGRIDIARATSESLSPGERIRLENEGYAPALGQTEPAVVSFTSLTAAWAVSEMLERFVGYGPAPRPSEVLLRCHDREISTNVATPMENHFCDIQSGKIGIGMTEPFLDKVWLV